MSRRRDYLTFFTNRKGRGEFIFAHDARHALRWILPAIVVAAAGGLAFWWFTGRAPQAQTDGPGVETMPTILHPVSTTTTLPGGSELACPESDGVVHWETFKADPSRAGCINAPLITTPTVLWAAKVGVQGWLNNPVVVGDTVYIGSAGTLQFDSDEADGVYALNLETGTRRWFFKASFDVNGVAANEDLVVATGDEGLVWGIEPTEGLALWTANLGESVFTNPLLVDQLAIVGDQSGTISAFDTTTGQRQWKATVAGAVRGGVAYDGRRIYAVGEQREVVALDLQGKVIWRETIPGRTGEGDQMRVFAAPVVAGDVVVISLVRDEVYGEPGLVALDRETGDIAWWATDAAGIKTEWGAVRSSPAVVGDLLVYGEGYSNNLVALSVADGKTQWAVETGPLCYPHWSSPAVVSGQVILPRFDGGLYSVDVASQTLAWSIYLGQQALNGAFPADFDEEFCEWQVRAGSSLLASPAVADDGTILVGTLEGYLFAIGNAEE
jgi:eukaryotic-like serine/threonine-protein kinase